MRSEEQKNRDVIIHEKRYRANEVLEIIKAWRQRALVVGAVSAVAAFAVLISFIIGAYDAQNIILMAALIVLYFVIILVSYNVGGSLIAKSFKAFRDARKLFRKWNDALLDFEAMEDKVAERTAMPGDMEKAEDKLISVADALASFAEKYGL